MKHLFYILITFLFLIFVNFQILHAQVSKNPERNRPIIRTPRPDNGNIPKRNGDEGTIIKERNPDQTNIPPKSNPDIQPYNPPIETPVYCPQPPEPPVVIIDVGIDYHPTIYINENPDKEIKSNPILTIEEYEQQIIRYDKILKQNPKDTIFYFLRGNAKLITEDYYGAIEDYSIYLKLVPWDKEAYFKRGLAFLYFGDKKNALLDFQIASELGYKKADSIRKYY